jgi:outer membrane protein assembly factor BamB
MKVLLYLCFLFLACPAYASEPAVDTLPPELARLRGEGRLTVRALWAWKLVPESTTATAMELRARGLDLIGADRAQLAEWLGQADEGSLALSPGQRDVLSSLMGMMDSGQAVAAPDPAVAEPAQAPAAVPPTAADEALGAAPAAIPDIEPTGIADVEPATVPDEASVSTPEVEPIVPPEAAPVAGSDVEPVPVADAASVAAPEVDPVAVPDAASVTTSDLASAETPGMALYRGVATRTGVSASPGPAGTPAELWKLKVGDGPCTPAVVLGGVACFGSVDGHLYAVDVATGALKWTFFAEDWIDQPPAMATGTVFFGNIVGDRSGDRHLFALDAATGSEKWRFKSLYYGVNSSPAMVDGAVCFGAGKHVYTADPQTGDVKWSFEASDSVGTPAVADGTVFFAHANRLTAVDLGAEAEKWTFRAGANITTCPAVSDGLVVFGSDDANIYGVDALTGAEKWKFGTGLIYHPLAVHDGVVYAVSYDNLHVLDAATGAEKWKVNMQRASLKAPVIDGDALILAAGNFLVSLDRASGQERWRYEAGGEITSPALWGGVAYFWSEDGYFHAVR